MAEEIKQAVEAVINHPKSSIAVTTFFTSHVWIDYGFPTLQALTSIVGFAVVVTIFIKNSMDIYKNWKGDKND